MERLHVNNIREIIHRLQQGQSERQIANDLRVSRHTVHKYREMAQKEDYLGDQKVLPRPQEIMASLGPRKGPPRTESTVVPYREVVQGFLAEGMEKVAMLARLRDDYGYKGSYSSLWRFVRQLQPKQVEAYVRVHSGPGEEAQVDFGSIGPLYDPHADRFKLAYVFVMTLCFSRHQYAEIVFDQKVSTWIVCHRHAFESFGGVPGRVVLDNLKAAVLTASLHDPVIGETYRRMAQHYGFVISPNRPRTPEHKGKVESGIHYVKRNFLAGQQFSDIAKANEELREWVREVAGTRQHGTTGEAPLKLFNSREKNALKPLPLHPFTLCEVRLVKLHNDCHVVIDGSFYSAPWQWVGQTLEAYIGERIVELYRGVDLVATHRRAEGRGEWHTRQEHYPPHKAAFLERTPQRCRELAERIGPATQEVVEALLAERPVDRLRSVQALLRLEENVGKGRLEAACGRALHFGDGRYRRIKDILNANLDVEPLPQGVVLLQSAQGGTVPGRKGTDEARTFTFARPTEEFFSVEEARL